MSLAFPPQPTRTDSTVSSYLKRAKALVRKARRDLNLSASDQLDLRQFASWLAERKSSLSKPSWRQYKNAAICFLETSDAPEAIEAARWLSEIDSAGCVTGSEKTSSSKLKRLPWKDFQKLTEFLRQNQGKWHIPLLDWLISGALTGLRPQEWALAKIATHEQERALVAQNAKSTNGRAHGPQRTLLLGALSQDEFAILSEHLRRANLWFQMGQYNDFYEGCALTLNYVCRKLWPRRKRHITLYSCRHQFSANAKASGFSNAEIGAMMGHAVDDTATRHYGKKTAGHEMIRVRALESDVDRVQRKAGAVSPKNLFTPSKPAPLEPLPKGYAPESANAPSAPDALGSKNN